MVKRTTATGLKACMRRMKPGDRISIRLTVAELKKLGISKIVDGGYQRDLSEKSVTGLVGFMKANPDLVPSILVAVINGKLYIIDGQHRVEASIRLNTPIWAELICMTEQDAARVFFLTANTKQRRVLTEVALAASNNPVAVTTRAMAAQFNSRRDHIKRMTSGYVNGLTAKFFDIIDPNAEFPADVKSIVTAVMEVWTSSPNWKPEAFPAESTGSPTRRIGGAIEEGTESAYCIPAVLQAVGAVVKTLGLTAADLEQIKALTKLMSDDFQWDALRHRKALAGQGMGQVCLLYKELHAMIARHLVRAQRSETKSKRKPKTKRSIAA